MKNIHNKLNNLLDDTMHFPPMDLSPLSEEPNKTLTKHALFDVPKLIKSLITHSTLDILNYKVF